MRNKALFVLSLLVVASMVLSACATPQATPEKVIETVVVTQEVMVEGTPVVQEVVVTPTNPPAKEFKSADPTTFTLAQFGQPETLDPALAYETAGGEIIQNIFDTLIGYNGADPNTFVPALATEVPSVENGGISADGTVYTFKIREGVTFHDGTPLTPEDVAYTFVRGILQGGTVSPQWLLTEPFYGAGTDDIAAIVMAKIEENGGGYPGEDPSAVYDSREEMAKVDPAILEAVATELMGKIAFDNEAGTVTMTLAGPWAPFLATLANGWGSILSKPWVIANGGWDGDPKTWQNFYAKSSEEINQTPIGIAPIGTGAYKLDHWTPGEEIVLVANEEYWGGAPAIKRAVMLSIDEFSTRFAMLQAGDADWVVAGSSADWPQLDTLVGEECRGADDFTSCTEIDPNLPLTRIMDRTSVNRTDMFFTFTINTEGGNNLIGSGLLDGNGIPANFFSDPHVRKGFAYCFNYQSYFEDVMQGEAVRSKNIMLPGMIGYQEDSPYYDYDPEKCTAELQASKWTDNGDGTYTPDENGAISLWETGFRFTAAYNTGNTARQTAGQILQTELSAINDKFIVEVTGLPWPTFLRNQRASNLPIFFSGWQEDIHDPHNWVVPYTTGTYGGRQKLPAEIKAQFAEINNRGVAEVDPEKRAAIYAEFNQLMYDTASVIPLFVLNNRRYEQRWVEGWYDNPIVSGQLFVIMSKK